MHRNAQFAKTSQGRWVSLNVIDTTDSYVLQERQIISGSQKMAEVALSIVAVGFIFCAYLRFLLPQTLFGTDAVPSPLVFSMAAVGIGLALYAFGTRGYLPEFGVDKKKDEIWICKLNSRGQTRVKSVFSKDDVKSVFVFRPENKSQDASLCLRLKGQARPLCLVRGRLAEMEAVHGSVCEVLHSGRPSSITKPIARIQPRRVSRLGNLQAAVA